jgi:uncharacterized protein (DUF58 family)
MFTKYWVYLAVFLIPLGIVFDNKALLTVSALLLTVIPAAWWWNRLSLRRIIYQRTFGERRAFPGETVELTLRVTNQKLLPLGWLVVEDQWPLALPLESGSLFPSPAGQVGYCANAFSVRWFERVNRRYRIRCTRRGFYPFGPVRLASGDIFGLFRQQSKDEHRDWLIVYPHVLPLETLGFSPKAPFGEVKAAWRLFEDPSRAIGIRDYQPDDAFRHIHWKATARRQDLQVKVYEPTTGHNLVVFLNVATFPKHWQGSKPMLLERAISVAASIANHAIEQRLVTGVIANGSIPHSDQSIKVPPSRRPDQLARIMEALAAVTSFATSSIEALLLAESPRLPWGATLVVVTAVVADDLIDALLRLHAAGRRVVLVSLEEEPLPQPLPPAIEHRTYHLAVSQLPFDDKFFGEGVEWIPEFAPPIRFTGGGE